MTVWVAQTSSFGSTDIESVAYGGGVWCAVGKAGKVATSPDGVTWTQHTTSWAGGSNFINSIIWDGSQFVAAGKVGGGVTPTSGVSPDGVTWTLHSLTGGQTPFRNAIAFGAGLYIIGQDNNGSYWSSPDAVTWTQHTFPSPYIGYGLIFDGTDFVAGFGNPGLLSAPQIAYSSDGLAWSVNPLTSFSAGDVPYVAYNGTSTYLAVDGTADKCETSPSRIWAGTPHTPGLAAGILVAAFGNNLFAASDNAGGVATSPDGATWTLETLSFSGGNSANDIAFGGTGSGQFVAVGTGGQLSTRSLGPPITTVPNVVGDTQAAAQAAIIAAFLTVGTVVPLHSSTVAAGIVISQSPVGGTMEPEGTAVNITVSLGPQQFPIPNVTNLPLGTAEAVLAAAGFITGTISFDNNSPRTVNGNISFQDPLPGTLEFLGTQVNLTIEVEALPFNALQTVISQYQNSPTLLQLVENMSTYVDPAANLLNFYNLVWNVDTAVGFGLDIWGRIVGVNRVIPIPGTFGTFGFENSDTPPDWENFGNFNAPTAGGPFFAGGVNTGSFTLNDNAFRTLVLAKALANIVATTAPALNRLVQNLFPGLGRAFTIDRGKSNASAGGMAMTYVFEFTLTTIQYAILAFSGVLPHPAGVLVSVQSAPSGSLFGFQDAGLAPFGQGTFNG